MKWYDDQPSDDDGDNWGGWRSGLRWHDDAPAGETAPLNGGDLGPAPVPITNPNE